MSLEVDFSDSIPGPFYMDVVKGLREDPPTIPCKYLYDQRGSELFNMICGQEEYYPTLTELGILVRYGAEMAAQIGRGARLVELGAGSGLKTRFLLDELEAPEVYMPVEISESALKQCAREICEEYPGLRVEPIEADYTGEWSLPERAGEERTVFFFPGSTVGNFSRKEAEEFLRGLVSRGGRDVGLLIGVDLHKDREVLEAAYNDREGVTAEFNLNLLRRINRECGANFALDRFEHRAVYDQERQRIEMRLVSLCDQIVAMEEESFMFKKGEYIVTEHSHKYRIEDFAELSEGAGWKIRAFWTDRHHRFSVWYLEGRRVH